MRVGIVGASFAKAAYLPALKHVPGAEVVALASQRMESAKATADAFGIPNAYDDWRTMLENHQFDLVCIATPTITHAPIALMALEKGANVLCEKPTALDAVEAKAMLDKAEALGKLHMIDHELRFNPNRRKAHEMIASGKLGMIRHANIVNISPSWGDPASRSMGDWWSMKDQGGGRLGANGSHQTDIVRWWFGEVASVSGQALTMIPDRLDKKTGEAWTATADDLTHFMLEMASGALVSVFISSVARNGLDNTMQVFGSEGTLVLSNTDEKLLFAKAGGEFEDITENDPNAALPGVNKGIWNVSVVAAMREFAAAIADKRPLKEGATFVDGWKNQLVLDAVLKSTEERRWIDL
jgi:predicted dehydrogenase